MTRIHLPLTVAVLLVFAVAARAQPTADIRSASVLRLGFEEPPDRDTGMPAGFQWHDRTPTATAVLDSVAYAGRTSLRLDNTTPGSVATVTYVVSDSLWRGAEAVHVRGRLRTHDVREGIPGIGAVAGFMLRADGADRIAADDAPARRRPDALAMANNFDAGPAGTTGWGRYALSVRVPPATERLVFAIAIVGSGTVWADDLEVEAVRVLAPPTAEALAYAHSVLDTLQARAYRTAAAPWDSLRAALPPAIAGARESRDTYEALRHMISRVDPHSHLFSPEQIAALDGSGEKSEQLPPLEMLPYEQIEGRFGYIVIPAFLGAGAERQTQYADAAQAALGALDRDGSCGYVVDLRPNWGGNMGPMLAGLGPLLGTGRLGSFVDRSGAEESHWRYEPDGLHAADAKRDALMVAVTESVSLATDTPPVAVLIGPGTASSGEAVLVSFRGRPATRFFGEPSAGFTTGNVPVKLSDGAFLNVTTGAMADRTGRAYDGPIGPDEVVPPGPEGGAVADDPAVRAALAWLASQQGCSGR